MPDLSGCTAFRFTQLNRATVVRVSGAKAINGDTINVKRIQRNTDGQVEEERSKAVVKNQGEIPVDQKARS